jgi:hypothetical protein
LPIALSFELVHLQEFLRSAKSLILNFSYKDFGPLALEKIDFKLGL